MLKFAVKLYKNHIFIKKVKKCFRIIKNILGEIDKAIENGFQLLMPFPERKKYKSDILFPIFSSRLPDRKRENINECVKAKLILNTK